MNYSQLSYTDLQKAIKAYLMREKPPYMEVDSAEVLTPKEESYFMLLMQNRLGLLNPVSLGDVHIFGHLIDGDAVAPDAVSTEAAPGGTSDGVATAEGTGEPEGDAQEPADAPKSGEGEPAADGSKSEDTEQVGDAEPAGDAADDTASEPGPGEGEASGEPAQDAPAEGETDQEQSAQNAAESTGNEPVGDADDTAKDQ